MPVSGARVRIVLDDRKAPGKGFRTTLGNGSVWIGKTRTGANGRFAAETLVVTGNNRNWDGFRISVNIEAEGHAGLEVTAAADGSLEAVLEPGEFRLGR